MTDPSTTAIRRPGYTHERGDIRRQELIDAAVQLLSQRDIDEVSFVDIARHAQMPTASAYQFHRNKNDLLAALVTHYHKEINEVVFSPCNTDEISSWGNIIDLIIDRAADYFRNNDVARKLFYSGKAPSEIKLLDRTGDKEIGSNLEQLLNMYFVVPDIPGKDRVFFILVELIDTLFILSVTEYGDITDAFIEETKRVTKAYLRTYLPEILVSKG